LGHYDNVDEDFVDDGVEEVRVARQTDRFSFSFSCVVVARVGKDDDAEDGTEKLDKPNEDFYREKFVQAIPRSCVDD
jgi:hypothetical protein